MRTILIAVTGALAALAFAPAVAAACTGANLTPTAANLGKVRAATKCLINVERNRHGVRPVRGDRKLQKASTRYARQMDRQNFFAHESPSGSHLEQRVRASGYLRGARGWTFGENIGWGSGSLATPAQMVRAWMNSPGHRANLLRASFREVGVGVSPGAPAGGVRGRAATYVTVYGTASR